MCKIHLFPRIFLLKIFDDQNKKLLIPKKYSEIISSKDYYGKVDDQSRKKRWNKICRKETTRITRRSYIVKKCYLLKVSESFSSHLNKIRSITACEEFCTRKLIIRFWFSDFPHTERLVVRIASVAARAYIALNPFSGAYRGVRCAAAF